MKKKLFLWVTIILFSITFHSNASANCPPNYYTATVSADNTALAWMNAIEASLQPNVCYVKIGNYGGGTDTAKKMAAVKSDIANALGISIEALDDMTGLDLIQVFFPTISTDDINEIGSGNSSVKGVSSESSNVFNIVVGMSTPSFVMHFQLT